MPPKPGPRAEKSEGPPADMAAPASFEAALSRLEEIVTKLERGEITLDQSLASFKEGSGLVRFCLERLSQAETTVQELMAGEAGSATVVPGRPGLEGDDDSAT